MPLSDSAVRSALPRPKPYKLAAGGGLYLLVKPSGSKLWRFDYRYGGQRKTLALGTFPDTRSDLALRKLIQAREALAAGTDPNQQRKDVKAAERARREHSFETIARDMLANQSAWAPSHLLKVQRRLELYAFPWIGRRPVDQLTPSEILRLAQRVQARGTLETAHRVLQNCGQVVRFAIQSHRAQTDPTRDLRGALKPWTPRHYATITDPRRVGELLRAIDGFTGTFPTCCALKLAPLLFVRPGELRRAEWTELDLDAAEWRIPAAKMKARAMHIVPLSRQAVEILRELQPLTGRGRYVFPGARSSKIPMSENTLSAALRRMGYAKDQMSAHGFRGMASTMLNEQGWNPDAIERQLAHGERDEVRAAYCHAQWLPDRRRMMQAWADYLDELRKGNVVPVHFDRAA